MNGLGVWTYAGAEKSEICVNKNSEPVGKKISNFTG